MNLSITYNRMKNPIRLALTTLLIVVPLTSTAQIGKYRNTFSIGANAGAAMSSVGFDPSVSQGQHVGLTGGLSWRYTSEKYFSTICSIAGEVNFAAIRWKEDIRDANDNPVVNTNGSVEKYSRTLNYIQIPVFAHLAWGRENNGFNFFIQAGPQIGILLSESTDRNYDSPNLDAQSGRSNTTVEQESMKVENKFDYGIAAGAGLEYANSHIGRWMLEARYYYGLGNIYGSSKRDYFSKSNIGNIVIKATWLVDLSK